MRMRLGKTLVVVALAICVVLPAGCARNRSTPQPPPVQSTMSVVVYYPKMTEADTYLVREAHNLPSSLDPKLAAVEELIKGAPATDGAYRVLPENTRVLGIKVDNSVATVDFSKEVLHANVGSSGEAMGIQSIVNTLTEFPDVKKVAFTVEGGVDERARDWWGHVGLYEQPFARDLSKVYEPVIWVTAPQPGAKITSPLTVTGSARVFEATVHLRLVTANGQKLAEAYPVATAGAPDRGDFTATMDFTSPGGGDGFLEAFWNSPKDGSELDMVRVPVKFQ